jgi:hypothetical protein
MSSTKNLLITRIMSHDWKINEGTSPVRQKTHLLETLTQQCRNLRWSRLLLLLRAPIFSQSPKITALSLGRSLITCLIPLNNIMATIQASTRVPSSLTLLHAWPLQHPKLSWMPMNLPKSSLSISESNQRPSFITNNESTSTPPFTLILTTFSWEELRWVRSVL